MYSFPVFIVLGLIIHILGTSANLQVAESSSEKYDEKYIIPKSINKIVEDFFQEMEKSEGVMAKDHLENNPVARNELMKSVVKDSEIQPSNPGRHFITNVLVIYPVHEQKDTVPNFDFKDSLSHPKNIIPKINEEKLVNGISKSEVEDKILIPYKIEQPKGEEAQANQQQIAIMKQQQLMETIKQYNQEQKELSREQKEILTELKLQKANKEFQQNKEDIDKIKAKKIPVDNIQKIANIPNQSLSGVPYKPVDVNTEKETVENTVNEAVNNIVQKAQKILDAIQQVDKKKNERLEKEKNVSR
ncbi:uncharacterized protein LOC123868095 [Maniola jurtina]|uniref:uncharacterized protein LOC123868095 n=1 Tax=Maniola jurtina TaxID=191418 RepID=UPI001E68A6D0|nr:uncharacterized protein LOC123868095 [Maniola jurtina]